MSQPPLLISLLQLRRVLNRMAERMEWDHELMDLVAEMQAHLYESFRGARHLMNTEE